MLAGNELDWRQFADLETAELPKGTIHIVDWGEELQSMNNWADHCFMLGHYSAKTRHQRRRELKQRVREHSIHYWCNSVDPSLADRGEWVHSWPEYDYRLGYQRPIPTDQLPLRLYHTQNRLLKPHRTQLVQSLWDWDRFAHGTVSYTQTREIQYQHYGEYKPLRLTDKWQDHVYTWLPSYESHDPELIPDVHNNPAPPLEFWYSAAINIVTETLLRYPNCTEKIWSCVCWGRPWIAVAAPGTHELFESQGFELFPHIDYSFDHMPNVNDRIKHIVGQLRSWADCDPTELYLSWKPTAERNRRRLLEKIAYDDIPYIILDDKIEFMPMALRMKNLVLNSQQQAQDILKDYRINDW